MDNTFLSNFTAENFHKPNSWKCLILVWYLQHVNIQFIVGLTVHRLKYKERRLSKTCTSEHQQQYFKENIKDIYMYINICIYIKYLVSTATCFSASASTVGSIILGMLKLETHYNTSNHNPIKAVYRCCVINLQMSLTHASCCLVAARAVWRVLCWCLWTVCSKQAHITGKPAWIYRTSVLY